MEEKRILVTGATGYIGARLIPHLIEKGYLVRATARSKKKLMGKHWAEHPDVELFPADVLDFEQIKSALQGCTYAYYLVHSMVREEKQFEKTDREAALNFVAAAEHAGIKRIIYLGGLGKEEDRLSRHLLSRKEVGEIFIQSSIPTTVFRAAMIIGSGCASFEIMRYLVQHLPVMITPRWVRTKVQPIAIANVLKYLVDALEVPETTGQVFDIGGPEVTTYEELMKLYAEIVGLRKRKIIRVGVLSPKLSSLWIGLVTPLPASLGRPLVEGLSNTVICENNRIRHLIPQHLLTYREAMERAVQQTLKNRIETSWRDAGTIPPSEWAQASDPHWAGGAKIKEHRSIMVEAPIKNVWKSICQIGGEKGWYSTSWLWQLRGFIDKLIGGVGLRRGRTNRETLAPGDAVDFWRVQEVITNKKLSFVAEMKLPGKALLEFQLEAISHTKTQLTMDVFFLPLGLWGLIYWYAVSPFHILIFRSMLKRIASDAASWEK